MSRIGQVELDKVKESVRKIKYGPRSLQLYMDICARCGACAEQCHVSQGDPERYSNPAFRSDRVRKLYNAERSVIGKLFSTAGLVNGNGNGLNEETLEEWARDFYACSGCRRCAIFCPLGIDNSVVTRKARSVLHSLQMTPTKLAATQKTSDQFGNDEGVTRATFLNTMHFLEEELLAQHGIPIRIPVDQRADVLFVTASGEILSRPEILMGCATFFHAAGISWTMSSEAFDAANFGLFTGDDAHMRRKNRVLHDACLKLKVKKLVIGECGHAYRVAGFIGGANYWGDIPYEVTSIFILAADVLRKGGLKLDPDRNPMTVTYHDPCNFARSTGLAEEPRAVLRACVSEFREMTPNREFNWCCGGGGGLAVLDGFEGVSKRDSSFYEYRMNKTGKKKLDQILATKVEYVAAPCGNCKRQIRQLMEYHKQDIEVGGIFDLFDRAVIL
jgi:Fe-S oxidoreductase